MENNRLADNSIIVPLRHKDAINEILMFLPSDTFNFKTRNKENLILTFNKYKIKKKLFKVLEREIMNIIGVYQNFKPERIFTNSIKVKRSIDVYKKLLEKKYIIGLGDGLFAYTEPFQRLLDAFDRMYQEIADKFNAEKISYPNMMSADVLARAGYFDFFPHLIYFISAFSKDEKILMESLSRTHFNLDDFEKSLKLSKMTLAHSACMHVYKQFQNNKINKPFIVVTTKARLFRSEIFTHKISDFSKLSEFNIRNIVFVGNENKVTGALNTVVEELKKILVDLKLNALIETASDPFFVSGLASRKMYQMSAKSKYEIRGYLVPEKKFVALGSVNRLGSHMTSLFNISFNKKQAHSGCVAFGLERIACVFLSQHGFDSKKWPRKIKNYL